MSRTEEFIRRARLKLSSNKYRFFGLCLYPIRIVSTVRQDDFEAWINYESNGQKFENQIYINEKIIDDRFGSYKTTNMIDIMLHELNHILRRHDIRCGNRNKETWNIACDHIIDCSLKRLRLSTPVVQYNIIKEIEYDDRYKSEEEVYSWLVKNQNNHYVDIQKNDNNGSIKFTNNSDNNEFEMFPDLSTKDISSEQKQVIDDYVSQIRAVYNIEKEKGSISSNLIELFDVLLKVDIPWEKILEKAIKSKSTEKANRRSWRKLNKFYVGLNISLPGFVPSSDKDAVSTLIVHIDSSGSIEKEDLRKAGYIISKSTQYFDKIILIIGDVRIKQEIVFRRLEYSKITDYFKSKGMEGGGGTSHKYVFEYFDKIYEENPDSLSLCISITDMYSDIEHVINSAEFIKSVPLILINTSNKKVIEKKNITTIIVND